MSAWRDTRPRGSRLRLSRYTLAGALLATLLVALGVVLAVTVGGHHQAARAGVRKAPAPEGRRTASIAGPSASTNTLAHAPRTHPGVAVAGSPNGAVAAGSVTEVRDPEEAKSFPAPASVHHKPASKPSTAAEVVVAPGAPSDAEVRRELGQMRAVERAARKQAAAAMTTVPGGGSIGGNGQLQIPQGIPEVIQRVIAGANAIADFPYVFGGGHGSFVDNSYDCSGSVSYALAAGGLLSAPETSGSLESWGAPGPGQWITVYANAGHTYMYVNIGGRWMRYDTSGRSGVYASRWQPAERSNAGFAARHWPGL